MWHPKAKEEGLGLHDSPSPGEAPADERPRSELETLRRRIDDLNLRILDLAQERAEVVLEISRLKDELGLDSHDPAREEKMLQKLTRSTSGPFGPGEVREIFQALFRASLALQERQRAPRHSPHPRAGGDTR